MHCVNSERAERERDHRISRCGFMPLLMGAVLVTTGCREIQISTTVHPDGAVERTYTLESDSLGIGMTAYPKSVTKTYDANGNKITEAYPTQREQTIERFITLLSGSPATRADLNAYLIYVLDEMGAETALPEAVESIQ